MGAKRTSISSDWMSAFSQKETFTALLDGMDSGAALSYSPVADDLFDRKDRVRLVVDDGLDVDIRV